MSKPEIMFSVFIRDHWLLKWWSWCDDWYITERMVMMWLKDPGSFRQAKIMPIDPKDCQRQLVVSPCGCQVCCTWHWPWNGSTPAASAMCLPPSPRAAASAAHRQVARPQRRECPRTSWRPWSWWWIGTRWNSLKCSVEPDGQTVTKNNKKPVMLGRAGLRKI